MSLNLLPATFFLAAAAVIRASGHFCCRLPFLRLLSTQLGVPIFALSYRGYGKSEGKPNEAGLMRDAVAAMEYVMKRQDLNSRNVVMYGRSLGGAVAIHLAALYQDQLKAVMVENTFTSLEVSGTGF